MPQFAYSKGWYTALYFSNTGTSPESFTVNFFSQNGNPLFVPLVGTAPASSKNVTLAPGSTVVLEAPNAGSLIQGWVDVTLPTAVIGYAIFRQSVPGRADQEAVVPLTPVSEKVASLSFDDTNLITTVGMLNPTNSEIVVIIEAYGPDGTFLTSTGHQLLPRSKTDFIVRNHVGLSVIAGKRGWLRFSTSTGALSVIGFRFGAEAFTSLPVDYGAATYQDFPTTFVLPQLAYGGGWYTALHFSSTRLDVTNVQVRFMSSEGSTLSVPLLGIGSASSQSVRLNPYSTAVLEAPNVGGLSQGWVEATVPSGVVGYAVFRQSVPGRADQEAVVLLTPQTSQIAEMIYDDTAFVTSVMYLNPTDQPVTVSVMAQGQDGAVVGTSQVALGPRTKQALTLRSLPGLQNVVGKRGRLQFSVPNPAVSVLGLRFGAEAFTSIPVTHR